jgi:hypothetical protein
LTSKGTHHMYAVHMHEREGWGRLTDI